LHTSCTRPYVFPIIGGRKIEHLKSNIDALNIELSPKGLEEIDDAEDFDYEFPAELIFGFHGKQKIKLGMSAKDAPLVQVASYLEEPESVKVPDNLSWFWMGASC
jgi:hypothetical protein